MAVGPCPGGSCLFIADIGDNSAKRQSVTVYRVAQPSGKEASVAVADVIQMKYPDGAHDEKPWLVTPDGTILIVTKGETEAGERLSRPCQRVPRGRGDARAHRRIHSRQGDSGAARNSTRTVRSLQTGSGSRSSRGEYWCSFEQRTSSKASGTRRAVWNTAALREPQGEGIALGTNNTVAPGR